MQGVIVPVDLLGEESAIFIRRRDNHTVTFECFPIARGDQSDPYAAGGHRTISEAVHPIQQCNPAILDAERLQIPFAKQRRAFVHGESNTVETFGQT